MWFQNETLCQTFEFSEKGINLVTKFSLIKRIRSGDLFYDGPISYYQTIRSQLTDRIFKLALIHTSVIYQIQEIN